MTNIKLCQLYYFLLYLYIEKLYKILEYVSYKTNKKIIDNFIKYYIYCEKHEKLLSIFKFTLKKMPILII